jgi:hypothetical protein
MSKQKQQEEEQEKQEPFPFSTKRASKRGQKLQAVTAGVRPQSGTRARAGKILTQEDSETEKLNSHIDAENNSLHGALYSAGHVCAAYQTAFGLERTLHRQNNYTGRIKSSSDTRAVFKQAAPAWLTPPELLAAPALCTCSQKHYFKQKKAFAGQRQGCTGSYSSETPKTLSRASSMAAAGILSV